MSLFGGGVFPPLRNMCLAVWFESQERESIVALKVITFLHRRDRRVFRHPFLAAR